MFSKSLNISFGFVFFNAHFGKGDHAFHIQDGGTGWLFKCSRHSLCDWFLVMIEIKYV